MCDCVCVYMGMCTFEYRDMWSPEEGTGTLEWILAAWHGYWKLNSGPLQK